MNYMIANFTDGWLGPEDPQWLYFFVLWPAWFMLIWGAWNWVRDGQDERRIKRSLDWPEVQGNVIGSRIVWGHVEIRYEYWIFAERHEGVHKFSLTPVPAGGRGGTALRSAERLGKEGNSYIADFPIDGKVILRYNRAKPAESVLYCAGELKPVDPNETKIDVHLVTLE